MAGRIAWGDLRRAARGWMGPLTLRILEWEVSRRSWTATQDLGRRMGRVGFRLHRRHRRAAMENISLAFGHDLPAARAVEIACECFQHLAMLLLEALRMTSMDADDLADVVRIEGAEHLDSALAAGKGGIIFSGHLGNWEVGAVRLLREGYPVLPLSRSPSSPRLARALAAVRRRLALEVIPVREGARGIMRALRRNHLVPIMADRFARGQGLTVRFFDQPTHVWHTPALMAQRLGCPIIPTHAIRQPDGAFVVEVDPPIEVQDTGDRDFDAWVATAHAMALLEEKVRRSPEQYTWPYHLWRPESTPPAPYPLCELPNPPVGACLEQVR